MLHGISKDLDATFDIIHELYMIIRNDLGENPATEEDDIDVNLMLFLTGYYLRFTFGEDYPAKEHGDIETQIIREVAKLFLRVFYDFLDIVE